MGKRILYLALSLVWFNFANASSENFKLYLRGQVVDSIEMMNQEMWKKQFSVRELNRMISRLNSAYETNLGVTTVLYTKALEKIKTQNASHSMELDSDLLFKEFQKINRHSVSVGQLESLIYVTRQRYKGHQRSLRFLVIKMLAYRIYLSQGDLKALYVAGSAGYFRFNTGSQHLNSFVEQCQLNPTDSACDKYLGPALNALNQAQQMKLGDD